MTPEGKALEIVDWFGEQVSLDTARELYGKKPLAACIAQALRDVERETLERAAQIAESFDDDDDRVDRQVKRQVAHSIRSLLQKEGG